MPDGRKSQTFTVVLLRVNGSLHLGNQFGTRCSEVGCDNSQFDRTAAVPDRINLNTANTCNRVDLFLIICDIAAERFTVDTGVILLTQSVSCITVFSRDKYSRNRCGIQTIHRLNRQE